jgi:predicted Zn-dependent protease
MPKALIGLFVLMLAMPALAVDQEAAKASYQQGNDFFDTFRFADAAAAYERATQQDPKFLEAYFNHALAEELVDRQKSIAAWKHFAELAATASDFSDELGQAQARIEGLTLLPAYPEGLQPSHYESSAGDYYKEVAEVSESNTWRTFPIKVCIGSVPNADWAQGTREAFKIWQSMFPLELTADPEEADIIFDWESGTSDDTHGGEETEWVQFQREGDSVTGRKVAHIAVDLRQRRSKDDIRAIVLHEMGHALGIHAHSESNGDIMYYAIQNKNRQVFIPNVIFPVSWKSLVSKPSQRDINTLIRLYNTPGSVVRLH